MSRYCYLCSNKKPKKGKSECTFHRFPVNPETRLAWIRFCKLSVSDEVKNVTLCSNHFKPEDFRRIGIGDNKYKMRLETGSVPSIFRPKKRKNFSTSTEVNECFKENLKEPQIIQFIENIPKIEINDDILQHCTSESPKEDFKEPQFMESIEYIPKLEINDEVFQNSATEFPEEDLMEPQIIQSMENIPKIEIIDGIFQNNATEMMESSDEESCSTTPKRPRFAQPRYPGDINNCLTATPRGAKQCLNVAMNAITKQREKIKCLQRVNRNLKKKVLSFQEFRNEMKKRKNKNLLSEESSEFLMDTNVMDQNNLEIIFVENELKNTEISQKDAQHLEDFTKVCRTCMNSDTILVPILESALQNGIKFVDLLLECASVQVHPSDSLPLNICNNCLNEVLRIYIFRKQCRNAEESLKKLLENSPTFEENENFNNEVSDNIQSLLNLNEELPRKSHQEIQECFKDEGTKRVRPRNYECELCHKMFEKHQLREHMRSHTKEKPYACELCDLSFSLRGNLQRHIKIHTGERSHICHHCGKGFIQSGSLRDHLKTHTNTSLLLQEEPDENGIFTCKYCKRLFRRQAPYLRHLENHTKKTDDPEQPIKNEIETEDVAQVNESDKFYFCDICDRLCKSKLLLNSHLLTHLQETSFLCSECGKGYKTKASLQTHIKMHSGEKPYSCTVCFKSFAHIGTFDSHMLIHSGVRPHHCHLCPKTFTQRSQLKYHLRTHNGERPYACTYCDKAFAVKGNLTVHVRTHTGDTPYVCTVCSKGFYDSSSLKKHKKNHEGDKTIIVGNNISSDDILHNYEETINSSTGDEIIEFEISTSSVTETNDENVDNIIEITNNSSPTGVSEL